MRTEPVLKETRAGRGINALLRRDCLVARASLVAQTVKNLPAMQETRVQSLGWEDPLEEGSILAWRTPGQRSLGGLQSMGLQRVRQD